MSKITLNTYQFIILIIYIYVFSYYWTPKPCCNTTDEYLDLLEKYNKTLAMLKKRKTNKKHAPAPAPIRVTMGQHSTNPNGLRPLQVDDSDEHLVNEMMN